MQKLERKRGGEKLEVEEEEEGRREKVGSGDGK